MVKENIRTVKLIYKTRLLLIFDYFYKLNYNYSIGDYMNLEEMKTKAFFNRELYRLGKISREEAKNNIMPYINKVNEIAKEKSLKYKVKFVKVNFSSFVR